MPIPKSWGNDWNYWEIWGASHLRAQWSLLMEMTVNKVAVLFGGNVAGSVDPDAARVANHFADHVFGSQLVPRPRQRWWWRLPTNGPLGDVIWPFIGCYRRWCLTVPKVKVTSVTNKTREKLNNKKKSYIFNLQFQYALGVSINNIHYINNKCSTNTNYEDNYYILTKNNRNLLLYTFKVITNYYF